MWWIPALIIPLAVLLVFDLVRRRAPPILLLVRDREEELEGVLRHLAGRGRPLFLLDLGSEDGSRGVAERLCRDLPDCYLLFGDLADGLAQVPAPVVLVVSLLGPWQAREIYPFL